MCTVIDLSWCDQVPLSPSSGFNWASERKGSLTFAAFSYSVPREVLASVGCQPAVPGSSVASSHWGVGLSSVITVSSAQSWCTALALMEKALWGKLKPATRLEESHFSRGRKMKSTVWNPPSTLACSPSPRTDKTTCHETLSSAFFFLNKAESKLCYIKMTNSHIFSKLQDL